MDPADLTNLAQDLLRGDLSVADFVHRLAHGGIADVGDAQLDLDRHRRCGFPEVVFGQGKSLESLERIFERLRAEGVDVFATRVPGEFAAKLERLFPTGRYNPIGRTFRIPLDSASIGAAPPRRSRADAWRSSRPAPATCQWPKKPVKPPCGWGPRSALCKT